MSSKLTWHDDFARANGWEYGIQCEQVRGEGRFYTLMIRIPGRSFFESDTTSAEVRPAVPDVRGVEGTRSYVRRRAQAHADLVVTHGQ